jgi:serine/threonine protein kinase
MRLMDSESTVEWHASAAGVVGRTDRSTDGTTRVGPSSVVAGRYQINRHLGTGGMGSVWLADDLVLRRDVALKRVVHDSPEDGASAWAEARSAAQVTHPGVVVVHDVLPDQDGSWIVMEALSGASLSTTITTRGRLPEVVVAEIALQLLSALQAIHDAGLVHRDVKPGNVQLCDGDRVVLTDFGLTSPPGVWGGLRAGAVAGSLPYLAPESIADGRFGPPSDLFALGVTLYRAVEGRAPFDTSTPLASLDAAQTPAPVRHAGSLGEVLAGLLDRDPASRMDTAEAARRLRATLHPAWNPPSTTHHTTPRRKP